MTWICYVSLVLVVMVSVANMTNFSPMSFQFVTYMNGSDVCSYDTSFAAMTIASLENFFPFLSGKPDAVKCSYYCAILGSTTECVGFNYWSNFGRCDFYKALPETCISQASCSFYSVSLLSSCQVVVHCNTAIITRTLCIGKWEHC